MTFLQPKKKRKVTVYSKEIDVEIFQFPRCGDLDFFTFNAQRLQRIDFYIDRCVYETCVVGRSGVFVIGMGGTDVISQIDAWQCVQRYGVDALLVRLTRRDSFTDNVWNGYIQ